MLGDESIGQIASHLCALSTHTKIYVKYIIFLSNIYDFNNTFSNHMASVTFALNPLAWENNNSIVAAEICHIYIYTYIYI